MVVLDRDGTVIVDKHYLADPNQIELMDRAVEGILALRALGLKVVIATNQSGINRGYFSHAALEEIHRRMCSRLDSAGAKLDAVYFCPHTPEERCTCRKPELGLLKQAAKDFGAVLTDIIVIGDNSCDIAMAKRAGVVSFLVGSDHLQDVLNDKLTPDYIVPNMYEAAQIIARTMTPNSNSKSRLISGNWRNDS